MKAWYDDNHDIFNNQDDVNTLRNLMMSKCGKEKFKCRQQGDHNCIVVMVLSLSEYVSEII